MFLNNKKNRKRTDGESLIYEAHLDPSLIRKPSVQSASRPKAVAGFKKVLRKKRARANDQDQRETEMAVTKDEVQNFISAEVSSLIGPSEATIDVDTPLIGHNRVLDSADLVVLLLAVEDYARENLGFDWDWTSDSAMSEARSVLRNIGSLADHLVNQQPA